jgi:hypothetical protein
MSNPAEDEMRTQMFKTMVALEKMAMVVTHHLTADKRPPPENSREIKDGATTIDGDLRVTGNLRVEGDSTISGCTSTVASERQSLPLPTELEEIGKVVAKHHRALGLLATFGMMKDKPAFGTDPSQAVARLLGMRACRNCVGTGWVARDESCDECERTGYIKA